MKRLLFFLVAFQCNTLSFAAAKTNAESKLNSENKSSSITTYKAAGCGVCCIVTVLGVAAMVGALAPKNFKDSKSCIRTDQTGNTTDCFAIITSACGNCSEIVSSGVQCADTNLYDLQQSIERDCGFNNTVVCFKKQTCNSCSPQASQNYRDYLKRQCRIQPQQQKTSRMQKFKKRQR